MKKFMRGMVVCLMFGWAIMVMSQAGPPAEGEETLQEAVGDIIEFELNALAGDAQNKLGEVAEQTVGLLQPVELTAAQVGPASDVGQLLNVYYDDFAKKSENAVNTFYRNTSNNIIDEAMELYDQLPAVAALADARKEDSSVAPNFENTRDSFERALEAFSDNMRDGLADLKNEALRDASTYIDARLREYQQSLALGTPLVYSEPVEKSGWLGEIKSFAGGFWRNFKKEALESKIDPKTGECEKIKTVDEKTGKLVEKEYNYGILSETKEKGAVCRSIVDQFKFTLNSSSKRLADEITTGAKRLASDITDDIKAKVAVVPDKVKAIISGEDKLLKKAEEAQKKIEASLKSYTPLMLAAKDFDIDKMIELLQQGVDVTKTNDNGETALLILTKTLAKRADIAPRDSVYISIIPLLKASINIADKEGTTPLIQAAKDKSNAIIETLLENGADPSQKDKKGKTAADYADSQGKQVFLQESAPAQEQFMRLVQLPQPNIQKIERLIKTGQITIDATDEKGNTPLLLAIKNNAKDLVSLLIGNWVDINKANTDGRTPLLMALELGNRNDIAKQLIDNEADVNKKNPKLGTTPLMQAAGQEVLFQGEPDIDIVQLILDKNPPIEAKNNSGYTALHYAVTALNLDAINKLIGAGANVNAVDTDGNNALQRLAFRYTALKERASDPKVNKTTEFNQLVNAIIDALVAAGIDVNHQNNDNQTAYFVFEASNAPEEILAKVRPPQQ